MRASKSATVAQVEHDPFHLVPSAKCDCCGGLHRTRNERLRSRFSNEVAARRVADACSSETGLVKIKCAPLPKCLESVGVTNQGNRDDLTRASIG